MSQLSVLLVEDNPADARLVREILGSDSGFDIAHAETLNASLALIAGRRFDVALVDHGLPDCTGTECVELVSDVQMDLPIIVLTGNEDRDLPFAVLRAGAQDFVTKEILTDTVAGHETLVRSIRYAIERKHSQLPGESRRDMGDADRLLVELVAGRNESSVTARSFGHESVSRAASEYFDEMVSQYSEALGKSLEEARFKVRTDKSEILREIGRKLGGAGGSPRDTVEIHVAALKAYGEKHNPAEVRNATDEARLILVEVMGYLAAYYRTQSMRGARPKGT